MRIEDTAGNVTYTIDNCDCGLTGGCYKCQPIRIPKQEITMDNMAERLHFYKEPKTTLRVVNGKLFFVDKGSPPK